MRPTRRKIKYVILSILREESLRLSQRTRSCLFHSVLQAMQPLHWLEYMILGSLINARSHNNRKSPDLAFSNQPSAISNQLSVISNQGRSVIA